MSYQNYSIQISYPQDESPDEEENLLSERRTDEPDPVTDEQLLLFFMAITLVFVVILLSAHALWLVLHGEVIINTFEDLHP